MRLFKGSKLLPKTTWNYFSSFIMVDLIFNWEVYVYSLVTFRSARQDCLSASNHQIIEIDCVLLTNPYRMIWKAGYMKINVRIVQENHVPVFLSTFSSTPLLKHLPYNSDSVLFAIHITGKAQSNTSSGSHLSLALEFRTADSSNRSCSPL